MGGLPWLGRSLTSPAREPWAGSSFLHLLRVSRINDRVPFPPSREAGFTCDPLAHVSRVVPRPAPGPRLAGSVGDGACWLGLVWVPLSLESTHVLGSSWCDCLPGVALL